MGVMIGLAAGLVIQTVRHSALSTANQQLEQRIAEFQTQLATPDQPAAPVASTGIGEEQQIELLRLRSQASQLRAATNESQRLRAQMDQLRASRQPTVAPSAAGAGAAGEAVPKEAWSFAGYATPEAALQAVLAAMTHGDYNAYVAALSPEEAQRVSEQFGGKTPEEISEKWRRQTEKLTSYRIVDQDAASAEETVLIVYMAGEKKLLPMQMRKVGQEWKYAGVRTD